MDIVKNKMYIFTNTASGDRTNIMASFPLWDKNMFLENVKKGKNYGRYRYGKVGGYMHLLKDMLLEEFEQVFSAEEFTTEEITELFRKEISLKYGEHAKKAKIKPLSKKDLERGCVYKDFSGQDYLYCGEVEKTTDKTYLKTYKSEKEPVKEENGYGFIWYNERMGFNADSFMVLKSPKKLMEKVESTKVELESEYIYETGKRTYSWNERKVTVRLL